MPSFYSNVSPELAQSIDRLTRLTYELRENRNGLLARYGVSDEPSLLERVRARTLEEHPAYEHYLSANILGAARETARNELAGLLEGRPRGGTNLHIELGDRIEEEFGERLTAFPELKQDALIVRLDNDVMLEIRYAERAAYALAWMRAGAVLRIDTAPLHSRLRTFPNHMHDVDGVTREDPITRADRDPWDNVRALMEALLREPLMEGRTG